MAPVLNSAGILTTLTDPLNKPHPRARPPCVGTKPTSTSDDPDGSFWMLFVVIAILGTNCGAAIYSTRHDPWAVAFVVASFLILVSLFYALRVFETQPIGSPGRAHAKGAVWTLVTLLTLMFSHRVAGLMPFPVAVAVWAMAGSTILGGFYILFICHDHGGVVATEEEEAAAKLAEIA
jgi:hypothetical protein